MPTTRRSAEKTLKILVADDTRANREILRVFLEKGGHTVILAGDGREAVERFAAENPDLVIMDVMMPVMDGFEATRQIKARTADRWVPVIFLSALDKDQNIVEGLESGGDDYLAKPINFVVLEAKIQSFARTLQLQSSLEEQRQEMAAVSANVADGLAAIDRDGLVLWHSPSFAAIFGIDVSMVGMSAAQVVVDELRDRVVAEFGAFLDDIDGTSGQVLRRETVCRHRDGRLLDVELAMSRTRSGNQSRVVLVVRDVTERKAMEASLRAKTERLQQYYEHQEREQSLTNEIMERVLEHPGLRNPGIAQWVSPSNGFSGDVVAAWRNADGCSYAMLADATGHGLAAAVSAMPMLATFLATASAGFDLPFIMPRINDVLRGMLPVGRFVAATVLRLDPGERTVQIWQGGMPQCLRIDRDGRVVGRWSSPNLALGVAEWNEGASQMQTATWQPGDAFVVFSDGLIEAFDRGGDAFGMERLEAALVGVAPEARIEAVRSALQAHTLGAPRGDDVSLLILDCDRMA